MTAPLIATSAGGVPCLLIAVSS